MKLILHNSDSRPIYEQIYHGIKTAIIKNELQSNSPLPSIRSLAKDLRISVITTKRAYDELERDGFIYTIAGKGSFVAEKSNNLVLESTMQEIEDHLRKASNLAKVAGISEREMHELLAIFFPQ